MFPWTFQTQQNVVYFQTLLNCCRFGWTYNTELSNTEKVFAKCNQIFHALFNSINYLRQQRRENIKWILIRVLFSALRSAFKGKKKTKYNLFMAWVPNDNSIQQNQIFREFLTILKQEVLIEFSKEMSFVETLKTFSFGISIKLTQ